MIYDIPFPDDDGDGVHYGNEHQEHIDIEGIPSLCSRNNINTDDLHLAILHLQLVTKILGSMTIMDPDDLNLFEKELLMEDMTRRQALIGGARRDFNLHAADRVLDPNKLPLMDLLVHFLYVRNYNFPLISRNAAAFLSQMMVRRPAVLLASLGPDQLVAAAVAVVQEIYEQINADTGLCSVRFSILAYINFLPTLWNMVNLERITHFELHEDVAILLFKLMSLIGASLMCGRGECLCYLTNDPKEYDRFHALFLCVSPVKEFFTDQDSVDDHPLTLASVATIEILSKWERAGIPIASHEMGFDDETKKEVAGLFLVTLPILEQAVQQTPSLAHGYDLMVDFCHKRTPSNSSASVFRADMVRCHLSSCSKTDRLKQCTGCNVAYYCCAKHQKEHWKMHREFCKTIRSTREGTKETRTDASLPF